MEGVARGGSQGASQRLHTVARARKMTGGRGEIGVRAACSPHSVCSVWPHSHGCAPACARLAALRFQEEVTILIARGSIKPAT